MRPGAYRGAPLDHSYVETTRGVLFCLAGSRHTSTELLGCPYYATRAAAGEWADTGATALVRDGVEYVRLRQPVRLTPAERVSWAEQLGVRPLPFAHLTALSRTDVRAILDPRDLLEERLKGPHDHGCAHTLLHTLLDRMGDPDGTSGLVGLTGSAALDDRPICDADDLDFLLYPPLDLLAWTDAVRAADYVVLGELRPDSAHLHAYAASRKIAGKRTLASWRAAARRRLDVAWVGDVKVDLTEVGAPADATRFPHDGRPCGRVQVAGRVETVERGYPFRVRLADGRTVVVAARGQQRTIRPGDRVVARGQAYEHGRRRIVLVEDLAPDVILVRR